MRTLRTFIFAIGLAALATACGGKDKAADTSNTGGDDMGTDTGGDAYGGDMYGGEEGGEGMDEGGMDEGGDEGME
jgi:hypothetical protein